MAAPVAHVAINADDPDATCAFYTDVFGWTYESYGPPGFNRVDRPDGNVHTVIQQRRDLVPTERAAVEVTFAVDDVDATAAAAIAAGGTIVMERATIPGVGHLVFFADPGGTVVGAIQYDVG